MSESGPEGRRRSPDAVVVFLTILAAALCLDGLGDSSLWYDEWLTALAADGSLGNLRRYVTEQAGIPPTVHAAGS